MLQLGVSILNRILAPLQPTSRAKELPRPCAHTFCSNSSLSYCAKEIGIAILRNLELLPMSSSLTSSPPSSSRSPSTVAKHSFLASNGSQSTFSWNSDAGWTERCHLCRKELCTLCNEAEYKFEMEIRGVNEMLNLECTETRICTPCGHHCCPGWVISTVVLCRKCGHVSCDACLEASRPGEGKCCKGCEPPAYVSPVVEKVKTAQQIIEKELRRGVENESRTFAVNGEETGRVVTEEKERWAYKRKKSEQVESTRIVL